MDLTPVSSQIGRDDQSWLGSARGTSQAQSIALAMSTFTAGTHYPNGYLPSGLPLSKLTVGPNAGSYGPWAANAARTVTDGATTNASTTVTSATGAFNSSDVGATVTGAGIPAGATIASVTNATTVVLSAAATATASSVSLTITDQTGSAALSGFLLTPVATPRVGSTATVVNGALLDAGRVIVAKLPIAVNAAAQSSNPRFVFV